MAEEELDTTQGANFRPFHSLAGADQGSSEGSHPHEGGEGEEWEVTAMQEQQTSKPQAVVPFHFLFSLRPESTQAPVR